MKRDRAGLLRRAGKLCDDVGHGNLRIGSRVPLRVRRSEALLRGERVIGHYRHDVIERDDLTHAGHCFRLRFVYGDQLSAEARRLRQYGELHPRQARINAELRAAVHLASAIETSMRRSDELERAGFLQRDLLGDRHFGGGIDERTVGQRASGARVDDDSFLRATGRRIDLPALRGGRHQHDARSCTGLTQRTVKTANRFGGAGHLDAYRRIRIELVVGGSVLDRDLVDIDLELFRDQHRQRRERALAHLDHR